jgi:uncharacterized protein YbjT (DUF2867 family)
VASLLSEPVAVSDVAEVLAETAAGTPQSSTRDLAGPDPHDFIDMARRTLTAPGEELRLVPSRSFGPFTVEIAGDVLLPGPDAGIAPTTFEGWRAGQQT